MNVLTCQNTLMNALGELLAEESQHLRRSFCVIYSDVVLLQLWMETEESDMRSCPLCQLIFPVGYPDDALIKHIDSHLENSKI